MERLFIAVLAAAILVFIAAGILLTTHVMIHASTHAATDWSLDQREALATISNGKRECL